jgi:predicted enzyme related to lactoylglutathione lyase
MMTEITEYVQGTPCWIDLSTLDIEAAKEFYAALFGWDYVVGPPENGGYTQALLRGKTVAGLMQSAPEQGQREAGWTTYLAADDADAIHKAVTENGGQPMIDVIDVMGEGRMLVAADPTGAAFGVWEAGRHRGSQLANEAGSVIWNELHTSDADRARAFYSAVFGLEIGEPFEGADYTTIKADGRDVGGIGATDEAEPEPTWSVYFAVTDTDEAIRTAERLGATVVSAPRDSPYGRIAGLRDPQGAMFSLLSVS